MRHGARGRRAHTPLALNVIVTVREASTVPPTTPAERAVGHLVSSTGIHMASSPSTTVCPPVKVITMGASGRTVIA